MKSQHLTCEYQHDIYGTLILQGIYQPFEADTDMPEGVELESVLAYDGEELYVWQTWTDSNGVKRHTCPHFDAREILAMESALLHRGEFTGRIGPAPECLAGIRRALGLADVVVVDGNVVVIDSVA
jgi:hypothetical protein